MEVTGRLSSHDFTRLGRLIYEECGIRMTPAKKTMLEARLQKRLRALGMSSFSEYCSFLFKGGESSSEVARMIDLVTTNKTDFFREADHFAYLAQRVLPEWQQRHGGAAGRSLSIWSAGCSSGEEPYTLAMVLHEYAAANPGFDYRILATDICSQVLEKALLGVYPEERSEPIPPGLRRKYLMRGVGERAGQVRIVPEIREKVRFRHLNFMADEYGLQQKMDVIFCRNVIIYFDRPTQERLMRRFQQHLAPGGVLFVGHSETLSGLDVQLAQVHPTVYRKAT